MTIADRVVTRSNFSIRPIQVIVLKVKVPGVRITPKE
jgi:hypothetical protein